MNTEMTTFYSTSAYVGQPHAHQSFSQISENNFNTLNSEGGAMYQPSVMQKASRPGGGTGTIEWESPVGDIPWVLMAVLITAFLLFVRKTKRA